MYPLDPVETSHKQNESPMAPPYVDRDDDMELTEMGMNVAENEKRDSITDEYETEARADDDTEESLDDIAYPKGRRTDTDPELSAMKDGTPSE